MSLRNISLNESLHVFRNCEQAIDDISRTIADDFAGRKMLSKSTGWYFVSNSVTAIREEDVKPNDTAYPIRIQYEPFPRFNIVMCVLDRKEHPDEIVLYVNIANLSSQIEGKSGKDAYNYIHNKVSHEFGHIRENYGLFWITSGKTRQKEVIDVSQTKRYVTSNIEHFFSFDDDDTQEELEQLYTVIHDIMYEFSPTEMSQRIRETYDFVSLYDTDELKMLEKSIIDADLRGIESDRYKLTARFFDMTQPMHYYRKMSREVEEITKCEDSDAGLKHSLTLAYYFKYYNIYKTDDPISRNLIEHLWTTSKFTADERKRYKSYYKHFCYFMSKSLRDFKHRLYSVIFALLHKRLWESFELNYFGRSFYEDAVGFRYKDVCALLESTKVTLFK